MHVCGIDEVSGVVDQCVRVRVRRSVRFEIDKEQITYR